VCELSWKAGQPGPLHVPESVYQGAELGFRHGPVRAGGNRLGAVRGFLWERRLRGQAWVANDPCWFVIDRKGTLTCAYPPNFSGATFYEKDIDRVLEELSKAAHE
jgi:hypothetical protein